MNNNDLKERRPHAYPSQEMVDWIKLAATYQRAGLGNSITKQTDQALCEMVTFLTQPAQVYATPPPPAEYTLEEIMSSMDGSHV